MARTVSAHERGSTGSTRCGEVVAPGERRSGVSLRRRRRMSPSPIDRREFLASGLVLAGAGVLGVSAVACSSDQGVAPPATPPDDAVARAGRPSTADLVEPRVIASVGGVLATAFTASTNPAVVAGRRVHQPVTYDGTFPGPTLWVRPGDTIDLTFTNRIVFAQTDTHPGYGRPPRVDNRANLHYHGMHI